MDEFEISEVIELVKRGCSYEKISEILSLRHPDITRGLSGRSVRRFCKDHNIEKLHENEIDEIIENAVEEVCQSLVYCMLLATLPSGRQKPRGQQYARLTIL